LFFFLYVFEKSQTVQEEDTKKRKGQRKRDKYIHISE